MELIELKNIVIKIKYSLDGLQRQREDRINEVENKSIECFQFEPRENRPGKKMMNQASGSCRTATKDPTFRVTEGDKRVGLKHFCV